MICNFRITCYDIVVDSKWMVDLNIYLRMACYDIVNDSKWMVDLFGDL